jgi:hypothetical protein
MTQRAIDHYTLRTFLDVVATGFLFFIDSQKETYTIRSEGLEVY